MAKKTASPESDVFTAILAMACLAVLATTVYVTLKCISFYGSEALFNIYIAK